MEVCASGKEHFYDKVVITEGSYWLGNKWRELWGMQQGSSFKVYVDDTEAAIAQRVMKDVRSVTFRANNGDAKELGSGFLQGRNWHGEKKDEWLVKSAHDSTLPYYIVNAATAWVAFNVADQRASLSAAQEKKEEKKKPSPTIFLEQAEAGPSVEEPKASEEERQAVDTKAKPERVAEPEQQEKQPEQKEEHHWMKVGEKYEKAGEKDAAAGQQEAKEQPSQKDEQINYEKKYIKEGKKMEEQYAPHMV